MCNVSIYFQNFRGLVTKTNDIFNNSSECTFDIIAGVETWLREDIADGEIINNGFYNLCRCDRNLEITGKVKGGGTMLAVSKKYKILRCVKKAAQYEVLIVDIKIKGGVKCCFVVVYMPPNLSDIYYRELFNFLQDNIKNSKVYILGDFNLPEVRGIHTNFTNLNRKLSLLNDFINYNSFRLHNDIKNSQGKTLDLVISSEQNSNYCIVKKEQLPIVPEDIYHPSLEITLVLNQSKISQNNKSEHTYFSFKNADFLQLTEMIRDADWETVLNKTDVNEAVDSFYNILENIFEICVPKIKTKIKNSGKYPIWFTQEVKDLLKEKNKARKLRWQSEQHNNGYLELRRRSKSLIRAAYKQYIENIEECISVDPNKFWSYVKNKKCCNESVCEYYFDNKLLSESEVTEKFAQYFHSIYDSRKPSLNINNLENNLNSMNNILNLPRLCDNDYNMAIKKLKPKITSGIDGLPPYIIKGCHEWLKLPLLYIYNLAIKTSTFPDRWKTAICTPVHKSGEKKDIENYRPISVMPAPAKLFEQILYSLLWNHIKPAVTVCQHGFVPNKSVDTNLFTLINDANEAIGTQSQLDIVFTDFRKAFDKVNHDILLQKLHNYGLGNDTLALYKSYLQNRSFIVKFNKNKSGKYIANSGVPQGSNLGPLLFVIFINDLPSVIYNSTCLLFADDCKIYKKIKCKEDCEALQRDIDRVCEWSLKHKLPFNLKKCTTITISHKKSPIVFDYKINKTDLMRVKVIRDLGVTYNDQLSFKGNIESAVTAANRMLGFIVRQTFSFTSIRIIKILYFAFVRSKLEYASIIWYTQPLIYLSMVEKVQNKLLRYLYYKRFHVRPDYNTIRSTFLRQEFNIPSLEFRRKMKVMIFLYKIVNNSINDSRLLSLIPFNVPSRQTRAPLLFNTTSIVNTSRAPLISMLRLSNEISGLMNLDFSVPFKQFKHTITEYFIQLEY